MRWLSAVIIAWLATCPARAGLFDPDAPKLDLEGQSGLVDLPHESFRLKLSDLLSTAATDRETKNRRDAIQTRDALLKKTPGAPADLVRLAIIRMRLGEGEAASADLHTAYGMNPRDYWPMTALGTLNLQLGDPVEAVRRLEAAQRDLSPGTPTLSPAAQAVCELELKLAQIRRRERAGLPAGRRPPPPEAVDALFDVKFVGESGEYEAGALAKSEKAKLPPNAIALVQQLLVWLPRDARLLWLLGELYNASGDTDSALAVFNECLDARRLDAPALKAHRQTIVAAMAAKAETEVAAQANAWLPDHQRLWLVVGLVIPVVLLLGFLQFRQVVRRRRR